MKFEFFLPKACFWSIMKMAERKNTRNLSQGPPNPGFMQEKAHRGDFLKTKTKQTPLKKCKHIWTHLLGIKECIHFALLYFALEWDGIESTSKDPIRDSIEMGLPALRASYHGCCLVWPQF